METKDSTKVRSSLFRAFGISVAINSIMILAGSVGGAFKPLSFLVWISNVIAAPPGLLTRTLVHTNPQSFQTFIVAAVEGMVIALVFYMLVAWIALLVWSSMQKSKTPA